MRILLIILTVLWTSFWTIIGIGIILGTPDQIAKDKEFIDSKLMPCVGFVKNFEKENNRIPNYREFYIWERDFFKDYTSDLTQEVDSLIPGMGTIQYIRSKNNIIVNDLNKFEKANWRTDYAIGIWRGEWTEYYYSWTDSYDTNNYSWKEAFIGLIYYLGLGIIPIIIWWFVYRKRKKQHITKCHM